MYERSEGMGMFVTHYDHMENYNGIMWALGDEATYNFDIYQGRTLNVGTQTTSILSLNSGIKKEYIDPLDNLVIKLRKKGIEAYCISPESKDRPEWNEIGLYNGLCQDIPFEDDYFSTLLCFSLLDESYPELQEIAESTPDFYLKTAEQFKT